jgi:hypothetical protein
VHPTPSGAKVYARLALAARPEPTPPAEEPPPDTTTTTAPPESPPPSDAPPPADPSPIPTAP